MKPLLVAIATLVSLHLVGCSTSKPREGKWLSYEQINVRLSKKIGMEPGDYVKACGRLINDGQFKTAKQLQPRTPGEPYEEVIVADAGSNYYDRKTGQLVAECGYWPCTRHPGFCNQHCLPREWTCGREMR